MSLTPEEQIDVTIKCGISIGCDKGDIWYYAVYPEELAAYTAAVEAKERERVSLIVQNILDTSPIYNMRLPNGEDIAVYSVIESQFRSIK